MPKALKKLANFISHPQEYYPNPEIFAYHLLKGLSKALAALGINKRQETGRDMFDWSLYNLHYRGEMKKDGKDWTLILASGDYIFQNGKLTQANPAIKPLHYNWQLIYETILQLNPASVLELGCGNGIHLNNLSVLAPGIELIGLDRDQKQLDYLSQTYPKLAATIRQADATAAWPKEAPLAELAFTQAVLMHIHTGDSHKTALANLFNSASKYVLMMEKSKNHDFFNDIKELQKSGAINWPEIHFYYRISEETKKPHLMICSRTPLDYPVWDRPDQLQNY